MRYKILICLVLAVATLAVFGQVIYHDFINYDDPIYVTENPHVRTGLTAENMTWAFTREYAANWHPLTWLSHMADCQLFDLKPGGHHLTSLLLHTASVLLLFLLLARMTGAVGRSAVVAALFALHPLHVESVAWVAERKDVLSGLFWMLTLMLYAGYAKRPGPVRYLATLGSFVLGLLAKPMLVTLPCVLLLMDYWPLARWGTGGGTGSEPGNGGAPAERHSTLARLLLEKVPFFAVSLAASMATLHAQRGGGAVVSATAVPFTFRLVNALLAYLRYLGNMLWPQDLAVIYPLSPSLTVWQGAGAAVALAGITFLTGRAARRHPYLLVGWLWFLGTLIPVIGLVQVGRQALADRYTYLPLIGPFIMVAWGVPLLVKEGERRKPILAIAASVAVLVLAVCSWFQVGYWANSVSLFSHAVQAVPDNYPAHTYLGNALAKQGRFAEAIDHFNEALRIRPDYEEAHAGLGNVLVKEGRITEAIAHFDEALRIRPDYGEVQIDLGTALAREGRTGEAIGHYQAALAYDPDSVDAHYNLGIALATEGRLAEAISQYQRALEIEPNRLDVRMNLGVVLSMAGRTEEAMAIYDTLLRSDPGNAEVHYNLGVILARQGRLDAAATQFGEAVRLSPGFAAARKSLETVERLRGKARVR